MSDTPHVKTVSGKKVVIYSLLGAVVLTLVLGYGTFYVAKWLQPILEKRAAAQKAQAAPQLPVSHP